MNKINKNIILGLACILVYCISSHFILLPYWIEGILSIGGLVLVVSGSNDDKLVQRN